MSSIQAQMQDLDNREAFALAQGREDLVDEIDAERRALQAQLDEEEAAEAGHAY